MSIESDTKKKYEKEKYEQYLEQLTETYNKNVEKYKDCNTRKLLRNTFDMNKTAAKKRLLLAYERIDTEEESAAVPISEKSLTLANEALNSIISDIEEKLASLIDINKSLDTSNTGVNIDSNSDLQRGIDLVNRNLQYCKKLLTKRLSEKEDEYRPRVEV